MTNFIKNNAIILHKILNALADNLVKVFIPLIILSKTENLFLCVLFLVLYSVFTAVLNYVLIVPLTKMPLTMILLHILPYCVLQFVVSLYSECNVFIVVIYALLMALGQTFYSVASNNYFMFENKKANAGKMSVGTNIGKIIMIFIGGMIISSSNIEYLTIICGVATLLYVLSIFPLFTLKQNYQKTLSAQYLSENKPLDSEMVKNFRIYHICFGLYQSVLDNVLPIFLYLNNLEFKSIVYVMAIIEIVKIFVTVIAQKMKSEKPYRTGILLAVIIFSIGVTAILFIKNNIMIYVISTIISATYPLIFIPNLNKFCNNVRTSDKPQYYMSIRDVEIFSLRPFLFLFMLAFNMELSFLIGIVSAIIIFELSKKIKDYN